MAGMECLFDDPKAASFYTESGVMSRTNSPMRLTGTCWIARVVRVRKINAPPLGFSRVASKSRFHVYR